MMIGKRSVNQRFNHLMLDTLLLNEFRNKGIDLPFEYHVKDNGHMIFASMGLKTNAKTKPYQVKLFPHDSFPQQQFLQVYFPERSAYIYKNLWNVLGTSLLMICMVGGIFYYSVNTLLSQKKLANIKNDFINNMTHELKTPLSTIGLALHVLQDKTIIQNENKTNRYLGIIEHENKRLATQVEKVLQVAQLEKGEIKLNFEKLSINELIADVCTKMEVQLEQVNGKIVQGCEAENHVIMADKVHFTNIIFNLLDNAIKYSNDNPLINISTTDQAQNLIIKINDNGIGMGKEHLHKIFDKFYRIPKGDLHDVKGYGLGLSYVKNILEMHNATIEVDSKLNQGSTFTITIPTLSNENFIS